MRIVFFLKSSYRTRRSFAHHARKPSVFYSERGGHHLALVVDELAEHNTVDLARFGPRRRAVLGCRPPRLPG